MAYLYRHIRLDKNEPFYIGAGSDLNYNRAYDKTQRTKYWKNIISSTNYKIDIIFDDITWKEACKKEIEFIALYGRKDLGKGSLCNFTDGGEGAYGRQITNETKQKIARSVKKNSHWKDGRKHTAEAITKIKAAGSKKVIDQSTSIVYSSVQEAAILNDIRPNTLTRKLSGIRKNNTNFILA